MAKVLDDRKQINQHLSDIELKLKDLRIRYEQYFAGVEKRAPVREREALERVIRRLNQRRIMQTDLRYRFQNLSGSFIPIRICGTGFSGKWMKVATIVIKPAV